MPRVAVIWAALLIAAAGLYGGARGYEFTDLDKASEPLQPVVAGGGVAPAAAPPPAPEFDEQAVRELARSEVRQIIRPRPAAAPRPAPEAGAEPTVETPSAEPLVEPPAPLAESSDQAPRP